MKIYSMIFPHIHNIKKYQYKGLHRRLFGEKPRFCSFCRRRINHLESVSFNQRSKVVSCDRGECRKQYARKQNGKSFFLPESFGCFEDDFVYDLSIKDNHNYFADGALVHNCHLLKSSKAQRTKAVKLLSSSIPSMLFLSGTPFLNRPEEMFTLLNMVDPSEWSNYYEYTKKYCDGQKTRFGWEAKGATNLFELRERISKYFLRRTKDDVLKELPKKVFVDYPVALIDDVRKEYDFAEEEFIRYLREMKAKHPAELARMNYSTEKLVQLGVLRALTTKGKLEAAKDLIDSIFEGGEKVLVFSVYNEPLEQLAEIYGDSSVMITGKTKNEDRGLFVDRFQNDPGCRVFLGGIKSAGVGITLTAANNVVFLDFSWTPADHAQAADRVHRPGQEASSVTIYQMYAEDTIDAFMIETLSFKKDVFDAVFSEKDDSAKGSNFVDDVIKSFVDKRLDK